MKFIGQFYIIEIMNKKFFRLRFLSPRRVRSFVGIFAILFLVCSLLLVGSYLDHSLAVANEIVVSRTSSLAESLQAKLKALFLSANMLYQEQGVFNWINASQSDSQLDVAMVQAVGNFMQSNLDVEGLVLYNQKQQRIYEVTRTDKKLYRSLDGFTESDILALIANPRQLLSYQLVEYRQRTMLAFSLPYSAYATEHNCRLVFIFDPNTIASHVDNVLSSDPLDGSSTFVVTGEHQLVMGCMPQALDLNVLTAQAPSTVPYWLSFLQNGYLFCKQSLALQDWTVCSVLYMDSFLSSHMPFLNFLFVCMLAFCLFMVICFIIHTYLMNAPFSRLADDLVAQLPSEAQTAINSEKERQDALEKLHSSIHYLLSQVTTIKQSAHEQLISNQFNAWVNTLCSDRQMDADQSAFFPYPQLQMGLIRIIGYDTQQPDYFKQRSLRQEVDCLLRINLLQHYPFARCVDMGDGTFSLFVNAQELSTSKVVAHLTEVIQQLNDMLHITACCAVSDLLSPNSTALPSIYRSLYKASFLSMAHKTVCTLQDYEAYCRTRPDEDEQQLTQDILNFTQSGNISAANRAIEKYCLLISELSSAERRSSVYSLYFSLFFTFSKQLAAGDYQSCMDVLSDCCNLSRVEGNLQDLCLAISQRIVSNAETSAQWHSIILDISEYIQNNIADPQLSVEMIAQRVGYSVNYVRSMFKTYVGTSISDYIRDQRIDTACRLLETSAVSLTKVMECSGYTNKSSFFTQFKSKTGLTPTEYRAKANKDAE